MRSSLTAFAIFGFGSAVTRGADATSPVDYTQRSEAFGPAAGAKVSPDKRAPVRNETVQDKRVDKPLVDKSVAPLSDRRAAIELTESRDKSVVEKDSKRPETRDQPTSVHNHQPAAISTAGNQAKPPMVAKYQESLAAASATNMARFPALDKATSAKINRFVFRKNPPEPAVPTDGRKVTPAAGGSVIQK